MSNTLHKVVINIVSELGQMETRNAGCKVLVTCVKHYHHYVAANDYWEMAQGLFTLLHG